MQRFDKWDRRFMQLAGTIAQWASCYQENRRIGAVIVKNKRILTTGYNGAPAGVKSCAERGECMRRKLNIPSGTRHELCYAIHAEQNAIISASRRGMLGSTLYLSGFEAGRPIEDATPCLICARLIKNAGIARVVNRKGEVRI